MHVLVEKEEKIFFSHFYNFMHLYDNSHHTKSVLDVFLQVHALKVRPNKDVRIFQFDSEKTVALLLSKTEPLPSAMMTGGC